MFLATRCVVWQVNEACEGAMEACIAQRARTVFPAGSNGEFDLPAGLSIVIDRGEGCHLWDKTGRCFLDFSMGWGSVLPGHAHPRILAAVQDQLARGTNFAYITNASLELAEKLVAISPACEQVRFCASGTEATMYLVRLARAFTGRPKILKFEGAYHGAHDLGVTNLFPRERVEYPLAVPTCSGVVQEQANRGTLIAPFNDAPKTSRILEQHRDELAMVLVEPLQRCVPPEAGFLEFLRGWTRENGVLLGFDEVVTGFRLARGGAQEYYGVVPDLVAYGKALGGGLPIGAFGGPRDIMQLVCEDRLDHAAYVWTASSTGGNPVSAAAALAALDVYGQDDVYRDLHALGAYLRAGMRDRLEQHAVTAQVIGDGPLTQIVFRAGGVRDYWSSRHEQPELGRRLMLELFRRGVFLNPMGTKLYLSLAHDRKICDEFCARLDAALTTVLGDHAKAPR